MWHRLAGADDFHYRPDARPWCEILHPPINHERRNTAASYRPARTCGD